MDYNETPDWEQADLFKDPLLLCDFRAESLGGGTNAVCAIGNGSLTVGISPWGELIYFRWPTPSHFDHLRYFTQAHGLRGVLFPRDTRWGKDAQSLDWRRYGKPYEVFPSLGAKGGIFFQSGDFNWLGDETWTSSRCYEPEGGPNVSTRLLKNNDEVNLCQWVNYNSDLLVQEFKIDAEAATKFFYYATFSPSNILDPKLGVPDSKKTGFAAVYLPQHSIILYFQPNIKDKKRILPYINKELSSDRIDDLYPEGGVFIAMGMDSPLDGIQIGFDRSWKSIPKYAPLSASDNAKKGKLNGNKGLIGPTNAGFERNLKDRQTVVTVLTAIAKKATDCENIIINARLRGLNEIKQKNIEHWLNLYEKVNVPSKAEALEKKVSRRSIINLFLGRDRNSGAIIASPSRQPPYHFDWPRDGAFFDLALDLAGFPEIVDHHLDFYRCNQRKNRFSLSLTWLLGLKFPIYSPRGHWHTHLYTDGRKGMLSLIPFEIDETSLIIWDIWRHELFIQESDRLKYQKKYLETLELAANAIYGYVNKRKGWIKRAFEDDNYIPSATLHGATAVLTGLASAIDAGNRWGADQENIEKWRKAYKELRRGILKRMEEGTILSKGGWRGIQWALFPSPLFENFNDKRADPLIAELIREVREKIDRKRFGYAYLAEQLFILGIVASKRPEIRPLLIRAIDEVIRKIPIQETYSFGEVTLWISMPGQNNLIPQQRTSIPHLWTGVCSYLSVEALYRPERFLNQIPPIPKYS